MAIPREISRRRCFYFAHPRYLRLVLLLILLIIIYRIRQSTGASYSTNKKISRNEIIGRVFDLFIKRAFRKVFSQIFITEGDTNV